MKFWLVALGLSFLVAAPILLALVRRRAGQAPAAAFDMQVYRDQLKEVDRDLARGVISPEDAARTRLEVSRRILEADRAIQNYGGDQQASNRTGWIAGIVCFVAVIGGALALYDRLGAVGYPDLPLEARKAAAEVNRASRPNQAQAETQSPNLPALAEPDPRLLELVEQLRKVVADRPDDQQGLTLLARNEAALGNFTAAYKAHSKLIALKGDQATGNDFAGLADMMVLAAGGYVSPEAEAALTQALQRDPQNGTARYYSGLLFAQTGRPDIAFRFWRGLLEQGPEDAPWIQPIRAQIDELAFRAGVEYTAPAPATSAPLRGPSAEDMDAAADMSPAERMEMIETMVDGLADRLASEGGPAEEWARLINALGTLGQTERAAAIWDEAQQVFAAAPAADLAMIRAAAIRIGLIE